MSDPSESQPRPQPRPSARSLADLLREAELVHKDVLDRCVRHSEKSGRALWFVLLREGLVAEQQLFRLLDEKLKLPVLEDDQLDGVVVAPELKQAITSVLAGHLGILPLERSTDGRKAALAMVDPTQDLTALLPKLASHGVTEIRRFLIRVGTLRLGMDMFYNRAWEPSDSGPPLDAPPKSDPSVVPKPASASGPGAISGENKPISGENKPISGENKRVSGENKPISGENKRVSGENKPISAETHQAERAQPPPVPPMPPLPVPVAVSQKNELPRSGNSLPPRSATPPPLPKEVSAPSRASAPKATVPSVRSGPHGVRPSFDKKSADKKPGPLTQADLVVEERPSNLSWDKDVLRVPSRAIAALSQPERNASIVDVLFRCAAQLCDELSSSAQTQWPDLVVKTATALTDRMGMLPRAQRELLLVAKIHALLQAKLAQKGRLPKPHGDRLGYPGTELLDAVLALLQNEFLDFLRLPQDDVPPLGLRIVTIVVEGLTLSHEGLANDQLEVRLRTHHSDGELLRFLIEHWSVEPPEFSSDNEPPGSSKRSSQLPETKPETKPETQSEPKPEPKLNSTEAQPAPAVSDQHSAITPRMPEVAWTCEVVSDLSSDGLLPYPASPTGKPGEPVKDPRE